MLVEGSVVYPIIYRYHPDKRILMKANSDRTLFQQFGGWLIKHFDVRFVPRAHAIHQDDSYSFSKNHGSRTWVYLKDNYYWRNPFFTSMIVGGRVRIQQT